MVLENPDLVTAVVNAAVISGSFNADDLYGNFSKSNIIPPSQILLLKKLNFFHVPSLHIAPSDSKFRNPFIDDDTSTKFIQQSKINFIEFISKHTDYVTHNSISESMRYNNYLFPKNINYDDMPLLQITLKEIASCKRFKM